MRPTNHPLASIPFLASLLVSCLLPQDSHVSAQTPEIQLVQVANGLEDPTALVSSRDGTGRMFLVEQCGKIKILTSGRLSNNLFLDLTGTVRCSGNEEGLLGLAFHPNFKQNKYFYVNFITGGNPRRTIIRRYSVSADDDNTADPNSFVDILTYNQPFSNHNGGDLAFGPNDGYLYIASGDGGSGGDPQNNAQNKDSLLGKILRLNVDDPSQDYIPTDNPFVNDEDAKSEIWAYGARNPWRMSFDKETGDFFFGDVGQNQNEEVNFQPADSSGGENYGWRMMEGFDCYNPSSGCQDPSLTLPILTYKTKRPDCSVIGGYRYRGRQVSALKGLYVYGDYCSGTIWAATENTTPNDGTSWTSEVLLTTNLSISSFGESEQGELYVVNLSGSVFKVVKKSINCQDDQDFVWKDNPKKTCSWLRQRGPKTRKKICRKTLPDSTQKVKNICPRACKAKCQ